MTKFAKSNKIDFVWRFEMEKEKTEDINTTKEKKENIDTTKEKKSFWGKRKSRLLSVILLSVVFGVMIFIVTPFEIYCNNIAEMNFSVRHFIGIQTLFAFALALLIFALLFFISEKVYQYIYPAIIGFVLMLFVQGNYLNIGMTSLAGDKLDGKTSVWTYIWNTSVWVLVIAGAIVAYRLVKKRSIMQTGALILSVAITATQLMSFSVNSLTTKGAYASEIDRVYGKYESNPRFLTNKDIEKLGEERNIIMFCVDRFDYVQYAEPAMKKYPDAFKFLNDGFTCYTDAISLYGNTFPAVGYMLSGIEYGNDDRKTYFEQVYTQNKTLSLLHENGYSIHLYNETYFDYTNANELPDYVENTIETTKDKVKTVVRRKFKFSLALTKMSLYRNLPFILKKVVGNIDSDSCNEYILHTSDDLGEYKEFSYDLRSAYYDIKAHDGEFKTQGEKNFTFIHVSGCHSSDYDANWKKTKKEDFLVSAKNSMEMINLYLKNMKEISPELYKKSTIIILGDHGKVENRTKKFKDAMLTTLFVKKANAENTELIKSNAPVSHENLWATVFESEGIEYDNTQWASPLQQKSTFTVDKEFKATKEYTERKFIWNKRRASLDRYDSIIYTIKGEARNFKNWVITSETFYNHPLFMN